MRHGCDTVDVRIDWVRAGTGPQDSYGYYECHIFYSPQGCDRGHVHINVSWGFLPEDFSDTLTVVCQEVGHSVGLGHRPRSNGTSCMSRVIDRSDLTAAHLDSHDRGHINANYQ